MAKVGLNLDTRKNRMKKEGDYPLVMKLSHKSNTIRISLGYSFHLNMWDQETLSVKGIPNDKHITAKVQGQLSKAKLFLLSNQIEIESMDVGELKKRIQTEIYSTDKTSPKLKTQYLSKKLNTASIIDYSEGKLERLKQSNKNGYAFAINT
ncbi:MAG: hypothetical protein WED10_09905, partial [Brumimicrobium sp.]